MADALRLQERIEPCQLTCQDNRVHLAWRRPDVDKRAARYNVVEGVGLHLDPEPVAGTTL